LTITTEDLRKRGIVPLGGLPRRGAESPEPRLLDPVIIAGIVASHPLPTRDPLTMPRVMGCDPSLNEAGFAMVGGPRREVRTATHRSKSAQERGEKVVALARFALDFARGGFAQDVAVVEGTYLSGRVSPASIVALGEAVGAVQGALCEYRVQRVEPDWMPQVLVGKTKGGSEKADRHAVARGLLERSGIGWPGRMSEHEADAVCLATAWLVQEGWM